MAYFKRCHEKKNGKVLCTKDPAKCEHLYYLQVEENGVREKGPVTKYMHLLPPGTPIPTTVNAVKDLEARLRLSMRPHPPVPPSLPPSTPPPAPTPAVDEVALVPTRPSALVPDVVSTLPPQLMTINEVVASWEKDYAPEECEGDESRASIMNYIRAKVGTESLVKLFDRETVRAFLRGVEKGRSDGTTNRYRAKWQSLISWCQAEYGVTLQSPLYSRRGNRKGLKAKDEAPGRDRRLGYHPFDAQLKGKREEIALRAAAAKLDDGGMMTARLDASIDGGFRRKELLSLTPNDIKWNHQGEGVHLHIRWNTSKRKFERWVPATPRMVRFLKTRQLLAKDAKIYGHFDGAPISKSQFRDDWEWVLAESGVNVRVREKTKSGWGIWKVTQDGDLNWHDLRHECASRLAETKMDPKALMKFMGHRSLQTTMRYINHASTVQRDHQKAVAKKYGIR